MAEEERDWTDWLTDPGGSLGRAIGEWGLSKGLSGFDWLNPARTGPAFGEVLAQAQARDPLISHLRQGANPPPATPTPLHPGAGGPGGMGLLAGLGGQAQAPNLFLDPATGKPYSARQLATPVTVGSSSSWQRQVTKGQQSMPGYQQALDRLAVQQATSTRAAAAAESQSAEARARTYEANQKAMEARQAEHEAAVGAQMAKVEELDTEAARLRAEVAQQKVDPDQWWANKTTGQRIGLALATGLTAMAQTWQGQGGSNPVMAMIERAIDRDVAAQRANIQSKRGQLQDVRGAMADIYARVGDMRQAEAQTRILLMEGLKTKLEAIGANTASQVVKHNAEAAIGQMTGRIIEAKNQAYQAAQDKVVTSSGGSRQTAPLLKVLQAAQKAQQKGPSIDKARQVSEKLRQRFAAVNGLRRDVAHFYKAYRNLGLPAGSTEWWGGKGAAVQEMGNRILDKYVTTIPNASVEHIKLFKGLLGGKYASDSDVKMRLGNMASELENTIQTSLEAEADAGMAVTPYVYREAQYRQLMRQAIGEGH
jgi:hypothetical protein